MQSNHKSVIHSAYFEPGGGSKTRAVISSFRLASRCIPSPWLKVILCAVREKVCEACLTV
jgi:hypothetical protein